MIIWTSLNGTVDQVAVDIAAALKAGPSPRLCKALAKMIDPNGRPVFPWRLKLQRPKRGRPEADARIGFAMATLVDDEDMSVKAAVAQVQNEFGAKGNSRAIIVGCIETRTRIARTG